MLIHGAWLSARSWETFAEYFENRGFAVTAPEWPRKHGDVEQLRDEAEELAGLGLNEIVDHYAALIRELDEPPVLVGHSFGGLIVELLLDRGLGRAGVALSPAPPKGILVLPFSSLKAASPALAHPSKRSGVVTLTLEEFTYGFVNTFSEEDAAAAYERYAVPETGRIFYEAGFANFALHPPPTCTSRTKTARRCSSSARRRTTRSRHRSPARSTRSTSTRRRGPTTSSSRGVRTCSSSGTAGGGRRRHRQLARRRARRGPRAQEAAGVAHGPRARRQGRRRHRREQGHRAGGRPYARGRGRGGRRRRPHARHPVRPRRGHVRRGGPGRARRPGRLVGEAVEQHGRVDVLVNNVGGVRLRLDGFLSITDADFEQSLPLNFLTALRATRAAVAT